MKKHFITTYRKMNTEYPISSKKVSIKIHFLEPIEIYK